MTQRVPNQTCVAAVALLVLPAPSSHCSNQYQKQIIDAFAMTCTCLCQWCGHIWDLGHWSLLKEKSFNWGYFRANVKLADQPNDGRPTAVLPPMERLPDQHGGQLQAPQGREVFHGCDHCLWRSEHQGPQDDPVCLQPLLQGDIGLQPVVLYRSHIHSTRHFWKRIQPNIPSSFWRMSLSRFVTWPVLFVFLNLLYLWTLESKIRVRWYLSVICTIIV